jgi:hypothetical protein
MCCGCIQIFLETAWFRLNNGGSLGQAASKVADLRKDERVNSDVYGDPLPLV